ncbi:protein mono-ADP-ribosyltransferase PARP12-like [Palaemon carinicauda]|uniref:protein mono-ADP-ribosyltransferase PARP12-like n=1 Tax=Palaemon carinicauda TaxID=392227 RepID=UPI0035B603A9
MGDCYHDDTDNHETSRRKEELEQYIFSMKDMLRQLNEVQEDVQPQTGYLYGPHVENREPRGRSRGRARGRWVDNRGRGGGPIGGYRINNPIGDFRRERPTQVCFQDHLENLEVQWSPGEQGYQIQSEDPDRGWNLKSDFRPNRGYRGRKDSPGQIYRNPSPGLIPYDINQYRTEHKGVQRYRGRRDSTGKRYTNQSPEFTPHDTNQYQAEHKDVQDDRIKEHITRHNPINAIRPQFLAETLATYQNFACSILQLLEQRNVHPPAVRGIVQKFPYIFVINAEEIALRPNIQLCQGHNNREGCQNPESCGGLHICERYIFDTCYEKGCIFGHRWRTGHNDPVLRKFLIERLPFPTLRQLVQFAQGPPPNSLSSLDICNNYNGEGCNFRNCSSLHICRSFVTELTRCNISNCQLNHNLFSSDCHQLLQKHGIATNEAPRDILVALLNINPSLKSNKICSSNVQSEDSNDNGEDKYNAIKKVVKENKTKSNSEQSKVNNKRSKNSKTKESIDSSDLEKDFSENIEADTENEENKTKLCTSEINKQRASLKRDSFRNESKSAPLKPEIRKTLWSHYLQGDVLVPEICYNSVESSCHNEGTNCQRLHATKHFHWQVKQQDSFWMNLRPDQVTCLEYAFCDPDKSNIKLPRLDPATLDYSVSGLFILMGRESWQADFKSMTISNTNKTKTLNIRRLITEHLEGQTIKSSSYVWYFLDKNNKWVKYGDADTTGASHLVSNITSDDIEKEYLQDPKTSMSFMNSKFTYLLDFKTMTQMNTTTRAIRKIVRRPYPHLQDHEREEKNEKTVVDLPISWEQMQAGMRVMLVTLAPSSTEYLKVVSLLKGRISASNILKVQRVQNPYLWRAFQNKVKEMIAVYKDESKVNVSQLFHGAPYDVVHNICSENFDWRLHGTKSGQSFGRGSYFAVNADYSYKYASPNSNNIRCMFVARVAMGAVTQGNSRMIRPPLNPLTLVLFDSTVDNVTKPTIIVKYDKQEYYPEYLLTLS